MFSTKILQYYIEGSMNNEKMSFQCLKDRFNETSATKVDLEGSKVISTHNNVILQYFLK